MYGCMRIRVSGDILAEQWPGLTVLWSAMQRMRRFPVLAPHPGSSAPRFLHRSPHPPCRPGDRELDGPADSYWPAGGASCCGPEVCHLRSVQLRSFPCFTHTGCHPTPPPPQLRTVIPFPASTSVTAPPPLLPPCDVRAAGLRCCSPRVGPGRSVRAPKLPDWTTSPINPCRPSRLSGLPVWNGGTSYLAQEVVVQ